MATSAVTSARQLLFALTGPEVYRHDGLCPVSWKHYFNPKRFDLTLCWVELLPLVPLAILLPFGAAEAWSLRKLETKRLSGFRGLGLYRAKLVCVYISNHIRSVTAHMLNAVHFRFSSSHEYLPRLGSGGSTIGSTILSNHRRLDIFKHTRWRTRCNLVRNRFYVVSHRWCSPTLLGHQSEAIVLHFAFLLALQHSCKSHRIPNKTCFTLPSASTWEFCPPMLYRSSASRNLQFRMSAARHFIWIHQAWRRRHTGRGSLRIVSNASTCICTPHQC
jgi:hypothetical protein